MFKMAQGLAHDDVPSVVTAKRNRIIAIVAGAITVVAIVLAFASEYFELPWKWIRPAAELLLLGELVGLVVLERHQQLFEPVHESVGEVRSQVGDIRELLIAANLQEMSARLVRLNDQMSAAGQLALCGSFAEVLHVLAQAAPEALARDQEEPQILRMGGLSGRVIAQQRWELSGGLEEYANALAGFYLLPDSPANSRARRWSIRVHCTIASVDALEAWMKGWKLEPASGPSRVNQEAKVFLPGRVEATLSPQLITDREVILTLDDTNGVLNWGLHLQGRQYASYFARWFDDMWAPIPTPTSSTRGAVQIRKRSSSSNANSK
jgi:hypothetical protein